MASINMFDKQYNDKVLLQKEGITILCPSIKQSPARFSFLENSREFILFSLLVLDIEPFHFKSEVI